MGFLIGRFLHWHLIRNLIKIEGPTRQQVLWKCRNDNLGGEQASKSTALPFSNGQISPPTFNNDG